MMQKSIQNFKKGMYVIFWDVDYKAFEVFNGITMLILGLAFVFLNSSQTIINRSLGFSFINPIYLVIIGMVTFGMFKMYAVTSNNVRMRKWLALIGSFIWAFLFVIFSQPPVKPTSVVFISTLVAFSIWAYIRLVIQDRGRRLLDPRDPFDNR